METWIADIAVLAACGGDSTEPKTSTSGGLNCGGTTPTQVAAGAHLVFDPATSGGCLVLPAAGAAGAEHLVVALSTSGQVTNSGLSTAYTLSGKPGGSVSAAIAALPESPSGLQRSVSPAARFHDMLRAKGRAWPTRPRSSAVTGATLAAAAAAALLPDLRQHDCTSCHRDRRAQAPGTGLVAMTHWRAGGFTRTISTGWAALRPVVYPIDTASLAGRPT